MKWLLDLDIRNDLKRLAVFFAEFVVLAHGWLWLGGSPDQGWLATGGLLIGTGIGQLLRFRHLTTRQMRLTLLAGVVGGLAFAAGLGSPLAALGGLGFALGLSGLPPHSGSPLGLLWTLLAGVLLGSTFLEMLPGTPGLLLATSSLLLLSVGSAFSDPAGFLSPPPPRSTLVQVLQGTLSALLALSLWQWLILPLSLDQEPPHGLLFGALFGYGLAFLLHSLRWPLPGTWLPLGQGITFLSLVACLHGALEGWVLSSWNTLELSWTRIFENLISPPSLLALLGAGVAGALPALLMTQPSLPETLQKNHGPLGGGHVLGLGLGLWITLLVGDLVLPGALAGIALTACACFVSTRAIRMWMGEGQLSFGQLSVGLLLPMLGLSTILGHAQLPGSPLTDPPLADGKEKSSLPAPGLVRQDRVGQVSVLPGNTEDRLRVGRLPMTGNGSRQGEKLATLVGLLACDQARSARVVHPGYGAGLETLLGAPVLSVEVASPSPLRLAGAAQLTPRLKRTDPRLKLIDAGLRMHRARPGSADLTLVFMPPTQHERMHLLSEKGLSQLAAQVGERGCVAIQLPLEASLPLGPVLKAFVQAFPGGSVWTSRQDRTQLILLGLTSHHQLSISRLEKTLRRADVQALAQELGLQDVKTLLSRVLFTPKGLARLTAQAWQDFEAVPAQMTRYGGLKGLQDALQPVEEMLADDETDPARLALVPALTQARQGHTIWLNLGEQLEEGALAKVVQEAQALQADPAQADESLKPLTTPYLARARELLKEGRAEKAEEQLTVARLLNPRDETAYLLLAEAARLRQDPVAQQKWLQEALTLSDQGLKASLALADVYREQGKVQDAISMLSPLLEKYGAEPILLHNLGALYLSRGGTKEAQALFERAIRLNDQLPEAHRGLATLYLQQGRLDAALIEARLAVTQKPDAEGYHLLGQLLLRMGDAAGARAALVECLLRDPDHVAARGAMGILYAEAGEFQRAREAWQQVLSIDPENKAARENLARLQAELGEGSGPAQNR
ncbi:MAG: tetratricopeptide repeat protein [Myxococcota bacterium]